MWTSRSRHLLTRLPIFWNKPRLFHSTLYRNSNRPKEYELRVGYAIAILQNDIPHFFKNGLTEHSIYSPNIILSDPHYTKLSIHGRTAYLGIAGMLKWSTTLYFDDILLEITNMRVLPNDINVDNDDYDKPSTLSFSSIEQAERDLKEKGVVKNLEVRWKLQGINNPSFFQSEERVRHIEGVFIYKFNDQGYIGEHRIQRIVPPPSRHVLLFHSLSVRLRSLFWENARRPPVFNPGV